MKSILEAIKLYPQEFIDTLEARANTTPNEFNRDNHNVMITAIASKDWQQVQETITDSWYQKPLEGVIFCLDRYSDIDNTVWKEVVKLFKEGKMV